MSGFRLFRRGARSTAAPFPDPPTVPVDDDVEAWVEVATGLMDRLGAPGGLVVALLGEALVDDHRPWWFGHEPSGSGLGDLLRAVGEEPDAADALLAAEATLVGRRVGRPSDAARVRWRASVTAAVSNPALADLLPARDPVHEEAERVWRAAAATQQPWRATRLDPGRALRQVRWFPGCETRTLIGYADPLGLASAQRSVSEHRWSAEEDAGLRPAAEIGDRSVDPLAWRLSALRFAADHHDWPRHEDGRAR